MVALISIVLALTLLGLIVLALHKYQAMEVEYNVDRTMPLPPLDESGQEATGPAEKQADPGKSAVTGPAPAQPAADRRRRSTPAAQASDSSASNSKHWEQTALGLKQEGDLEGAIAACRQALPLWGAFKQITIILRQAMQQDSDPGRRRQHLQELYDTAVLAELLHDKQTDLPRLKLKELRQLDLAAAARLEFPYQEIGYAHLRLLSKGDIKQIQDLWGRPAQHGMPRKHHADWWLQQVTRIRD